MRSIGHKRTTAAIVIGLLAAGWTGCQDGGVPIGRVSGTVMLDGKPLANAVVKFHPQGLGRSSQAETDENGRYVLQYVAGKQGALVATHAVQITTRVEPDLDDRGVVMKEGRSELVPATYNEQSELVKEVKKGSQRIDFDLRSGDP